MSYRLKTEANTMTVDHRSRTRWIVVLVGSMMFVAAALVFWNHHVKASANSRSSTQNVGSEDVGSQMADYLKQGRYDDAVQVGLKSLENQPSDEIIYHQIAVVYLTHAEKDAERREQWVEKAVSYVEKALSLNSKQKDTAGVHLLLHARSFEVAGDLSVAARCAYYRRARKLLEERVPLLQGDQLTLEGKTFPLDPVRKENESTLNEVKGKIEKAACK
jgi:hypothetical protein